MRISNIHNLEQFVVYPNFLNDHFLNFIIPTNVVILIKSDIIGFYYYVLWFGQYNLYPLDFSE